MVGEDDGRSDNFFCVMSDLISSDEARTLTFPLLPDPGRKDFPCSFDLSLSADPERCEYKDNSSSSLESLDDTLEYFLLSLDFLWGLLNLLWTMLS